MNCYYQSFTRLNETHHTQLFSSFLISGSHFSALFFLCCLTGLVFSFPRAGVALDVPDAFTHLALETTNWSLRTWSRVAVEGALEVGLCNKAQT